jgi:DNA polymerase III alpha subunit (gram-positive type)
MLSRDLLVFDLETTGLDYYSNEIIQIAALRLDKETLSEKGSFQSYVKPTHLETANPAAALVHQIDYQILMNELEIGAVLDKLEAQFPATEVILSSYNTVFDVPFLSVAYKKLGRQMPYDLHSVDIWSMAYRYWYSGGYAVNPEKQMGFGLSDIAKILQVESSGSFHNAITDTRVAAEVLRRLLTS